jgi:deazaflavin-dependent oxidoreductase (nitroreductase family)
MTGPQATPPRDYASTGPLRRMVRKTAATRPLTWLYTRIQQPTDQALYRLTRGRITASSLLSGLPVVLLTTTGARSGRHWTVPVLGIPDGESLIIVASNYGRPRHPGWYHNLRAHPVAKVSVNGVTRQMRARELAGPEREARFERAAALYPGFLAYRERASGRRIPVLLLVRTARPGPGPDQAGTRGQGDGATG